MAPPAQYRTTHTPNLESRHCSVLGQIVFPEAKCRNCKAWQVKAGRLEEKRVFQVGSLQSLVRLVVTWRGGAGTVHPSQSEREAKCRQMREHAFQPATSGEMTGDARQDTKAGSGRNDADEALFISHNTSPALRYGGRSNQRATWPLCSEAQGSLVFDCGMLRRTGLYAIKDEQRLRHTLVARSRSPSFDARACFLPRFEFSFTLTTGFELTDISLCYRPLNPSFILALRLRMLHRSGSTCRPPRGRSI